MTDLLATEAALRPQDYRAFWTTDAAPGWTKAIVDQAGSWLGPKFDTYVDLSVDGITRGQFGQRLEVRRHRKGREDALRFVMEERNPGGHYTTSLTAVERPRGGGWMSLEVVREGGGFVNRPNLARFLLEALPLFDGAEMADTPRVVSVSGVADVLELLQAGARRGPVFIAGTDQELPFDPFVDLVGKWTKEVVGIGHVIVLDPAATEAFSAAVGRVWETPAWAVRTFLPGVDLEDAASARANRILGAARLGQDRDSFLAKMLGRIARDLMGERPTPPDLLAWRRTFDRIETKALTESFTPRLRPRPEVEPIIPLLEARDRTSDLLVAQDEIDRLIGELARVQNMLGLPDLSDAHLLELLDEATAERVDPEALADAANQLERSRDQIEILQDKLETAKIDRLYAVEEFEKLERESDDQARRIRYFTRELVGLERPDLAYGGTPPEEDSGAGLGPEPRSFGELLDRLPDLEGRRVYFTGAPEVTLALGGIDADGKALQMAWSALSALVDYVRAKGDEVADGSVNKFLRDQPIGYHCFPVNRHAATETGYTKTHYGDERDLQVPLDVHHSGKVRMLEHFKLARINRLDPRLYYYDDTARSGNIYVGYIGPHMTNSQTTT